MIEKNSSNLLPVGFYDLLFDEAESNHKKINAALEVFFAAGYRLIKPTLVEFEQTLLNNAIHCEIKNSFRAIDAISGKNLTLRSDITPQISRILATRLKDEKLPLKICYVGDVLRATSNDLYADRQQTQLGLEFIGNENEQFNLEIISVLFAALGKINDGKMLVEFSSLSFLEIFIGEIEPDQTKRAELQEAILQKNLSAIKKLVSADNAAAISKIATTNTNALEIFSEISVKIKSAKILAELQKKLAAFEKILSFLTTNFPQIEVRFDLFGDHKSSYSYDISFDIFCGNFPYAIACGGSYEINKIKAMGATIYMNNLRKVC
jgi:ATP phosphoribosyltransferase regulatory subunit